MYRTISHSDHLSGAAIHGELTIPQLLEKSSLLWTIGEERGGWGGGAHSCTQRIQPPFYPWPG